jgi:hypothetical protein
MKLVQVIAVSALAMAAQAQATPSDAPPVPQAEADVRRLYLVCDAESARRLLDAVEGAYCSAVAERLLRHYFKGDLPALLAWWRAEKAQRGASRGGGGGEGATASVGP